MVLNFGCARHLILHVLFMASAALGFAVAADVPHPSQRCGTSTTLQSPRVATTPEDIGGLHLTARGTLRVLIVFASFPDDTLPHAYWPARQKPLFMDQFIDPDTLTKSRNPFNLTYYFDQMSLGRFHFIGDAIWVESSESQEVYRANGSYGRANWIILQERVDPVVDFSRYDHWTKVTDYTHINAPDGQVDMIIMVWRTAMFEYLGEASLGYKPTIKADSVRIEMGFPEYYPAPRGSGVTCEYPYNDDPLKAMRTMAHEVGHWLLGGLHPYNGRKPDGKFQFWSILCPSQRMSSCANAYERERLGWITVPDLPPDSSVSLGDFVTAGAAFKYHPAGGEANEYFFIENHQKLSPLDDATTNPDDKGIWILHQSGAYVEEDNLRIRPSDGTWTWNVSGGTAPCFGQAVPVFARGVPTVRRGLSHRDQIPTPTSTVEWMYAFQDPSGAVRCGNYLAGDQFYGAFTPHTHNVFSAFSNPSSDTWNHVTTSFWLEVLGDAAGRISIRSFANSLTGSPAARYLGIDPTVQRPKAGQLSLAWGSQWPDGQRLESDVASSELECRIGEQGSWTTVYRGPTTAWTDSSRTYDAAGSVPVFFRARVRNAQGRYSLWSNDFRVTAVALTDAGTRLAGQDHLPLAFRLEQNYPNPFNGISNFGFRISSLCSVRLTVYDLLGHEVATLMNERKAPGTYTVTFDAGGLASGVYLYRLQSGEEVAVRKMVVVK